MPIIIDGFVTVSTDKLKYHEGHEIKVHTIDGRTGLYCVDDGIIEQEPKPSTSLPCGCPDREEHDEGVRLQNEMRRRYPRELRNRAICVGCYTGDDAPSIHSCVIHEQKFWPDKA